MSGKREMSRVGKRSMHLSVFFCSSTKVAFEPPLEIFICAHQVHLAAVFRERFLLKSGRALDCSRAKYIYIYRWFRYMYVYFMSGISYALRVCVCVESGVDVGSQFLALNNWTSENSARWFILSDQSQQTDSLAPQVSPRNRVGCALVFENNKVWGSRPRRDCVTGRTARLCVCVCFDLFANWHWLNGRSV